MTAVLSQVSSEEVRVRDKGAVMMESEVGAMCFEDGGRGHEPKKVTESRTCKRQENGFPLGPPQEMQLY